MGGEAANCARPTHAPATCRVECGKPWLRFKVELSLYSEAILLKKLYSLSDTYSISYIQSYVIVTTINWLWPTGVSSASFLIPNAAAEWDGRKLRFMWLQTQTQACIGRCWHIIIRLVLLHLSSPLTPGHSSIVEKYHED